MVDKYNQIIQEGPAKLAEKWGIALSLIEGIEETRREDARIYVENIMRKFYYDPKLLVTSPQHIILMGSSGQGKTFLAQKLGEILGKINILVNGDKPITTSAPDFIAPFVGQTAPKTKMTLISNLERVLFIDEAYSLIGCGTDDKPAEYSYGAMDAIPVIIQFIEKYAALQIVILAGYERTMMDCFLKTNEGINRRFPHKFVLQPYTALELARIIIKKLKDAVKLNNEPKFEHDLESLIKEAIKNHSLKKLLQPFQPRPRMRREFVKFMKMTGPKEKPVDGTDPSNLFFVYQAADMETLASDIMSSFLNSKYTFADDKGSSGSRSRSSKRTRRNKKTDQRKSKGGGKDDDVEVVDDIAYNILAQVFETFCEQRADFLQSKYADFIRAHHTLLTAKKTKQQEDLPKMVPEALQT